MEHSRWTIKNRNERSEVKPDQWVVQDKSSAGGRQHQDLQLLLEELARPQEPVQRLVDGPAGGGGQRQDL